MTQKPCKQCEDTMYIEHANTGFCGDKCRKARKREQDKATFAAYKERVGKRRAAGRPKIGEDFSDEKAEMIWREKFASQQQAYYEPLPLPREERIGG